MSLPGGETGLIAGCGLRGQCGMLKRDLEPGRGGGGGAGARGGQTPSSAWEGQGLRVQRPQKVAEGEGGGTVSMSPE